jgi:cytochrome c-type biogenesis protein CcsB
MIEAEFSLLWSAVVAYTLAAVFSIVGLVFRRAFPRILPTLLIAGVLMHTVAIALRWIRIDRAPVSNSFEMLSANIWGLMLAVTIGYWLLPRARAFVAVVAPLVIMLMAWMLMKPFDVSPVPPTYKTVWLFIHIGLIKLFLGAAFVALGLAGIILLRRFAWFQDRFSGLPDNEVLDGRMYRFLAVALIFDTLGIAAGAIWAQDAWGRYWQFDPLETWSLLTWLSIALTLHVRTPFKTTPRTNAWMTVGVFVVAFFTFFGIPFVSTGMHKGQI